MNELLLQYRQLVRTDEERQDLKKQLKDRAKKLEDRVLSRYENLDEEIEKVRNRIRENLGDEERAEFDDAVVEIVPRRVVRIVNDDSLAAWLRLNGKDSLIKGINFDKRGVNTIVLARDTAELETDGVEVEVEKDLRITLND